MFGIEEERSFEGRVTEFEMQYIKAKTKASHKCKNNIGEMLGDQQRKRTIQKLKQQQIQILKQKILLLQAMQVQTARKFEQEISVLQDYISVQQVLVHNTKIQILQFKAQIFQIKKDTKTVASFLNGKTWAKNATKKQYDRKQLRNTSPSIKKIKITSPYQLQKSKSKEKNKLVQSDRQSRKLIHKKHLSQDNFKNLSTMDSKSNQINTRKK